MNHIKHVAIIMDGNGRWGIKNKNSRNLGHKEGLKTVEKIIKASIQRKIKFLTLYVFSTENWKRPKKEINFLFKLLENFLIDKIDDINKQNIKLKFIGKKFNYSKINNVLTNAEKITKNNSKLHINLALNYGSKTEIVNSCNQLVKKNKKINLKNINKYLYTENTPDPDLLIRTGNTFRLSNFMLWQIAYSEIFFEKKLWPDFNKKDYFNILDKFKKIKRKFGKIE